MEQKQRQAIIKMIIGFTIMWFALAMMLAGMLSITAMDKGYNMWSRITYEFTTGTFWIIMLIVALFLAALIVYSVRMANKPAEMRAVGTFGVKYGVIILRICAIGLILGMLILTAALVHFLAVGDYRMVSIILPSIVIAVLNLIIILFQRQVIPIEKSFNAMRGGKKFAQQEFDERYQLVVEKAAATALYWILGLVFVLGSLYDILITRRWPVRSIGEVVLILLVWTVAYRYWAKRM